MIGSRIISQSYPQTTCHSSDSSERNERRYHNSIRKHAKCDAFCWALMLYCPSRGLHMEKCSPRSLQALTMNSRHVLRRTAEFQGGAESAGL